MNPFRPTCRPTAFDADLSGQVLIPNAVNYLRRHPVGTIDAHTREILRRELAGWLAEYNRIVDVLPPEDLAQYRTAVAEVLAKVQGAMDRLDGNGQTESLNLREADLPEDTDHRTSAGGARRTLAS